MAKFINSDEFIFNKENDRPDYVPVVEFCENGKHKYSVFAEVDKKAIRKRRTSKTLKR